MRKIHYIRKHAVVPIFWFFAGASIGLFFFISFLYIFFQKTYATVVYPGVMVNGIHFGGKSKNDVKNFFAKKNDATSQTLFTFSWNDEKATISAKELGVGYNQNLLADQAFSIGRSDNILSNVTLIVQAYITGVNLPPSYHYNDNALNNLLGPIAQKIKVDPVDALFTYQNGRVSAFRLSSDGREMDIYAVKEAVREKMLALLLEEKKNDTTIAIPVITLKPKITTDKANDLGIDGLLATGTSLYQHSIPNRIYNVALAAGRINGVLVAPGEVFSFAKAIGDVSSFTGYKQAYVIQDGKTILGDGGGVCQVSTTLFRAVLNAGLPVVERHAHDYRVGYYEEDSPPGIDATVYVPTIDFKFKNDTSAYILVQSIVDESNLRLTFLLYGKRDNRQVTLSKPIIASQTPPPPPLYQDDPTILKGTIQQVDFEAWGANVSFTRQVIKNGMIIISETYISNYRPWQAVFLRGRG